MTAKTNHVSVLPETTQDPVVTQLAIQQLEHARNWIKFTTLILFISLPIGMLFCFVFVAKAMHDSTGSITLLLYFTGLITTIFIIKSLSIFEKSIVRLSENRKQHDLEQAMTAQLKFWKLVSILISLPMVLAIIKLS